MINQLYERLDDIYDEIVSVRRHLHKHPELSFQEYETAKYIANYHKQLGHKVRTGVGGNGVLAYLEGEHPGPTVALRADFDALPIQEETDLPFKSINDGVMHACGHDGHTATILGLAKVLNSMKDQIPGTVVFLHQHAEESPPGGAIEMIKDGCLEGVDVIFGNHLISRKPLGEIGYRVGAATAAVDNFDITIKGKGGHAAGPYKTIDSIVIGSQLVNNLQQIVSRKVDTLEPVVLSVTSFEAKNPYNIIAGQAKLSGTVRTFNEDVRSFIEKEMEKVIKGTCSISDADYDFEYHRGYPSMHNHEDKTNFLANLAKTVPGVEEVKIVEPNLGGEDFAYYLQEVKGAFFNTGAKSPDCIEPYPHHHPKVEFDERALLIAAKVLGKATLTYMTEH